LSGGPGTTIAVFPEVLDHEGNIAAISNSGFRMPEPKTTWELANEFLRAGDERIQS
jgi:hypothetical protein